MQEPQVIFPVYEKNPDPDDKLFGLKVAAYRPVTETEFRQLIGAMLTALSDGDGIAPDYKNYCLELGEYLANDDPIGDPDLDYSLLGTFQTVAQYLE